MKPTHPLVQGTHPLVQGTHPLVQGTHPVHDVSPPFVCDALEYSYHGEQDVVEGSDAIIGARPTEAAFRLVCHAVIAFVLLYGARRLALGEIKL